MAEKSSLNYKALIKGILFSLLITVLLIVIITLICYFGNISEKVLGLMLFAASGISVFVSSLFLAKSVKKAGFIYGSLNGLGYFVLILAASICFSGKFSPSAQIFTMLAATFFSGALGGVIGINNQ